MAQGLCDDTMMIWADRRSFGNEASTPNDFAFAPRPFSARTDHPLPAIGKRLPAWAMAMGRYSICSCTPCSLAMRRMLSRAYLMRPNAVLMLTLVVSAISLKDICW